MWTGWNARLTEDTLPLQNVEYMPNIGHPPTDNKVLAKTLEISQQVAKQYGEQYALELLSALPGFHAFTRCDFTASSWTSAKSSP